MLQSDLSIEIYADGADVKGMVDMYKRGFVRGFTTNPTLMKKAGVCNYISFAKDVLTQINDMPVSFEVFSDNFDCMEEEARVLNSLGDNVYVKIPITNTNGDASAPLIKRLIEADIKVNVTAIFTANQISRLLEILPKDANCILSIFAGRIADSGVDPENVIKTAKTMCREYRNVKILWASCREVFNIIQAQRSGADIITVTNDILEKSDLLGKDLTEFSLDTVKMFSKDAAQLGFSIL